MASALSFLRLKQLVSGKGQSARFPAQRYDDVGVWLNVAEQDVWDAADWTFKKAAGKQLTVDRARPTMPPGFAEARFVYDDHGAPLEELSSDSFDRRYGAVTATGRPEAFCTVDRRLQFGPAPDREYTFELSFRRRIVHKDKSGDPVEGPMSADDDTPWWDDHHFLLVPRAQIIGLKSLNDPTWPPLQEEYEGLFVNMIADYVDRPNTPRQYGRAAW